MYSFVTLAFLVTFVSSSSLLVCLDNGGIDVASLDLPASQNPCIGYPRGMENMMPNKMTSENSCGVPFGSASLSFPSTYLVAGSSFYPEWTAGGHAGSNAGSVRFYLSKAGDTADPSPSEFEENLICELAFSNCNTKLDANDAPCTGACSLPADVATGKYVIQWRWELSADEEYSTCADIEVVAAKQERTWGHRTTTTSTTKKATTSTTTATTTTTTNKATTTTTTAKGTTTKTATTSSTSTGNGNGGTTTLQGDAINISPSSKKSGNFFDIGGILAVVFGGLFLLTLAGLITLWAKKVRKTAPAAADAGGDAGASSSASVRDSYPEPPSNREISSRHLGESTA